jgi:hypothetical protein
MEIYSNYYAVNNLTNDPIIMNSAVPDQLGKPSSFMVCVTNDNSVLVIPTWKEKPVTHQDIRFPNVAGLINNEHIKWCYRIYGYISDGKIVDYEVHNHGALVDRVKVPLNAPKKTIVNVYAKSRMICMEWKGNLVDTINSLTFDEVWSE